MSTLMSIVSVAAILAATSAGLAVAADLPKEGDYDYQVCYTRNVTRIDFSEAHRAYSYEESGTAVSNPPGGLFDADAVRCVGAFAIFSGKRSGTSICEGVAQDGAKRLARFQYDADNKLVRDEVAGTGKYEGMVTTGTVREVVKPKEVKPGTTTFCNQATGTYKLK